MSLDESETWVSVGQFGSGREADQLALVLVAAGIDCQLVRDAQGVSIRVAAGNVLKAEWELAEYAAANRPPPPPEKRPATVRNALTGVLLYWIVLLLFNGMANGDSFGIDWYGIGDAQAGLIVNGQLWRAVTALTLHANAGHILSNLVAGSLFGFFLGERLGSGMAWLLILLAGIFGNVLNSVVQGAGHDAIGASTAIFGAVGLLAVLAFRQRLKRTGLRRWAPLASAVMLLALLGVEGDNVDVGAHIAGLVAGGILGLALASIRPKPSARTDVIGGIATVVLLFGAWAAAIVAGG